MGTLYEAARKRIRKLLLNIYPEQQITDKYLEDLYALIEENLSEVTCGLTKWDQTDAVMITYGNTITGKQTSPLQSLHHFMDEHLEWEISCIHLLPFFPYSSDDGFAITDYFQVNPRLGTWDDLHRIGQEFDLMADLVVNHVSSAHPWFQNYLQGRSPGADFFIEVDPQTDLSQVTRPRSTPLLTKFHTARGGKHLWTTFSQDQIDLDFSNPRVLLEILRVLFFYLNQGIRIIRLDAIAYLWKKIGTSCIHLPQTHRIVKLMRELAELINPDAILLTETNVPDRENRSYFGENFDEAHMIYQFPLPPLLLYTLHTGNSQKLTEWAQTIPTPDDEATYFNFTASHDGIGLRPAEGIIPSSRLEEMVGQMKAFGGYVNTKSNPDGSESPYEINISWFDAMKGTHEGPDNHQVERFLCSQTIMMSLRGIPGFYIHSLLATENDHQEVARTGQNRSINRKTWDYDQLIERLNDQSHPAHQVFTRLKKLMRIRSRQPAFHPNADQAILDLGSQLFALRRTHESGQSLWSISNITAQSHIFDLRLLESQGKMHDLISGQTWSFDQEITLEPYQTLWLTPA